MLGVRGGLFVAMPFVFMGVSFAVTSSGFVRVDVVFAFGFAFAVGFAVGFFVIFAILFSFVFSFVTQTWLARKPN
jgi:Ni,Fe-hydrogenase I cytochrome b subunit